MKRLGVLLAVAAAVLAVPPTVVAQENVPTVVVGTFLDDQPSVQDSTALYTLYLPVGFDATQRHPVLMIFDPRGRARLAAELFRPAADRFGWILVSSNDTRSDGEWEPNRKAIAALWPEVHYLNGADPRRLYAAGFSGGAIVAWVLAQATHEIAGIVSVGGRLAPEVSTDRIEFVHWGAAGSWDFNLTEMRAIEDLLERSEVPHRLEVFDGPHAWCSPELAEQAIGWMELQAMRRELRPVDDDLVTTLWDEDIGRAEALEAAGHLVAAERRWRAIADTFDGLHDVEPAIAASERLRSMHEFEAAERAQRRADAADERFIRERLPLLTAMGVREEPITVARLRRELDIDRLLEESAGNGPEAVAARRMLHRVSTQASFYLPREFMTHGRWREAETSLELAVLADPDAAPYVWYNLACAASRMGHLDRALEALGEAVERGFADADHARSDPDLEALRSSPEHGPRMAALLSQHDVH
jgi:dienelactone hydrolase